MGEEALLANAQVTPSAALSLPTTCSKHFCCLTSRLDCRTAGAPGPPVPRPRQRPATHERARVKWKRWRRPRKVTKERAGKLRVVTWQ